MKKEIKTDRAPMPAGPYSQGLIVGKRIYVAGQVPFDPVTRKVADTIQEQTHQVMKNLEAILSEAGMTFKNVVKATIFLKNMDDFAAMNEIYASYLDTESFPARETVQVSCLPKNVDIEISMIAVK